MASWSWVWNGQQWVQKFNPDPGRISVMGAPSPGPAPTKPGTVIGEVAGGMTDLRKIEKKPSPKMPNPKLPPKIPNPKLPKPGPTPMPPYPNPRPKPIKTTDDMKKIGGPVKVGVTPKLGLLTKPPQEEINMRVKSAVAKAIK